jgi:3-oxoacyl-[acyl-carrier protein] reductase
MGDFLLNIGQESKMGQLLGKVGVPIPPTLRRAKGPWPEYPFKGSAIVVGGKGAAHEAIAKALLPAGAAVHLAADVMEAYAGTAEAYARPVQLHEKADDEPKAEAFVYDATGAATVGDLADMYEFFHARIRKVRKCGRIVVVGRLPKEQKELTGAAASGALNGFVRSMAKEIGKKGATANLIYVAEGAEDRIGGPLRFLLMPNSAYVTGQPYIVSRTVKPPSDVPFVQPLAGKVALLTGAARGIGAATAELLAREGAHVVCLDRPEDDELLSKVARKVEGSALPLDLAEEGAADAIAAYLREKYGHVDIIVHNAGITRDKTLGKMSEEAWRLTLNINLDAIIRITERLLDGPLRTDGRIVGLSSIAGLAGNFGQTNYAASKAGLISFVQALSKRVGRRGIAVNAVAPGFIETRMTAAIPLATREVGRRLANLSQGGLPGDVGELITFLSSPGAYGLTGTVNRVCGGNLIGA